MLPHFIQQVCYWGGGRGPSIAAKVLSAANNLPATRLAIVNAAIGNLAVGNILGAINQIVSLHGLGISFGSKQLRMLRPDLCGVLDALVRLNCGYRNSPADYVTYCSDCSAKAAALNASGILTSTGQLWNAGSVDMAVFAWIKNRSVSKPWNCRCAGNGHALSSPCAPGAAPRSKEDGGSVPVRARKESPKKDNLSGVVDRGIENPRNGGPAGDIFIEKTDRYFALKRDCGKGTRNIGVLEELPPNIPDGTLNAKRDLVDEIAARGGNFLVQPGFHPAIPPALRTRRVSGQNYIGWREFGNINAAIKYLQLYFTVQACDNATRQAIVDHGGPALP
jgi:hypothetical protein